MNKPLSYSGSRGMAAMTVVVVWTFSFISLRRTVTQDRGKAAKILGWPNAVQAGDGAEAPIKELPMDSSSNLE